MIFQTTCIGRKRPSSALKLGDPAVLPYISTCFMEGLLKRLYIRASATLPARSVNQENHHWSINDIRPSGLAIPLLQHFMKWKTGIHCIEQEYRVSFNVLAFISGRCCATITPFREQFLPVLYKQFFAAATTVCQCTSTWFSHFATARQCCTGLIIPSTYQVPPGHLALSAGIPVYHVFCSRYRCSGLILDYYISCIWTIR